MRHLFGRGQQNQNEGEYIHYILQCGKLNKHHNYKLFQWCYQLYSKLQLFCIYGETIEQARLMSQEIGISDNIQKYMQPQKQSNLLPLNEHHQNIVNAFRFSQKIQQGLTEARTSTQTTPTQKKIQQILRPEIIPATKNFIDSKMPFQKLAQFSAYPELQQFYVMVCDDLMDTMSLPLTPIRDGNKVQMDSNRLPRLFGIITASIPIYQKLPIIFQLVQSQGLRHDYKRRFITMLVAKADKFLEFSNFKISSQNVKQVVLNPYAMKQVENDDKVVEKSNNLVISDLLAQQKKKQPYNFEKLADKRVQQSIKRKFLDQGVIKPRQHWSIINQSDLIDIRHQRSHVIAQQTVNSLLR